MQQTLLLRIGIPEFLNFISLPGMALSGGQFNPVACFPNGATFPGPVFSGPAGWGVAAIGPGASLPFPLTITNTSHAPYCLGNRFMSHVPVAKQFGETT